MVKDIECFPSEIETRLLANRELLEDAEVEVNASGQGQGVPTDVSKGKSNGIGEGGRIIKQGPAVARILIGGKPRTGIRNPIRTRAGPRAIAHAGVVRGVGHVKGGARLGDGNTGNLPTAKECVGKPAGLEERKGVDIADRKIVALVEIGASAIGGKIVRVDKRGIAPVGRVVDRVAVGVRHAQRQVAEGSLRSELQGMIDRISSVPKGIDVAESFEIRSLRIDIDESASNVQVSSGLLSQCHGRSDHGLSRCPSDSWLNWLSGRLVRSSAGAVGCLLASNWIGRAQGAGVGKG